MVGSRAGEEVAGRKGHLRKPAARLGVCAAARGGGADGTPSLSRGQIVYARDGRRVGRIEEVRADAFCVRGAPSRSDRWLRRETVARVTEGGVVYLHGILADLDGSTSPTNPARPE